jgi:hypothetical protein
MFFRFHFAIIPFRILIVILKGKIMKEKLLASLGAVLIAFTFTSAANASTLNFYNDLPTDTLRFSVGCTGCSAYEGTSPTTWGVDGDLFELTNSGSGSETSEVNSITDEDYADWSAKDETGTMTFTSSAEYILIKIGQTPNYGLIMNSLVDNTFIFTEIGRGAGLSHVTEFGQISVVPVPAAFWLFGSALLGFVGMSRRIKVS